ncbi:MAG: hypothetical protein J6Z26_07555, partial [Bacteroidales bacterium]|nr:hypothetical protein [Bacteroidales bacterium]
MNDLIAKRRKTYSPPLWAIEKSTGLFSFSALRTIEKSTGLFSFSALVGYRKVHWTFLHPYPTRIGPR